MSEQDPAKIFMIDAKVGTLEQRVGELAVNTSQQLTALRDETHRQFEGMRKETAGSLRSIVDAIGDLQKSVASSAIAAQANGRITLKDIWPALAAMTGFLGLVGAILYAPISQSISRIETRQEVFAAAMVPRGEHVEKWRAYEADVARIEADRRLAADRLDRRLERFEARLERQENRARNPERQ